MPLKIVSFHFYLIVISSSLRQTNRMKVNNFLSSHITKHIQLHWHISINRTHLWHNNDHKEFHFRSLNHCSIIFRNTHTAIWMRFIVEWEIEIDDTYRQAVIIIRRSTINRRSVGALLNCLSSHFTIFCVSFHRIKINKSKSNVILKGDEQQKKTCVEIFYFILLHRTDKEKEIVILH